MRKAWGAALLVALAAVAFFLLIPPASQGNAAAVQNISGSSFGAYSSEIADAGEGKVAVLRLFRFSDEEGVVSVFCSEAPLQKNMLLLKHASAPGVPSGLSDAVARELAQCGFSSRKADVQDALSSENAVIISPTGATPLELAEKSEELEHGNSRVIVLESLPGRMIDSTGALSGGEAAGFEIVSIEPGEEASAAQEAARKSLFLPGMNPVTAMNARGNFTLAIQVNSSAAYCRAVYIGKDGGCRSSDIGQIIPAAGRLLGPKKALAGKDSIFEFELANGTEMGRRLRFFAALFSGQDEFAHQEIAGGEIKGGFASRFALNFSSGGKFIVRIMDQFGRKHAAAYVEVAGLSIQPVFQQGSRYEYDVEFGGEKAEGKVLAWIDGGEAKEYYATDGRLVVWAAPKPGSHVMNFEYRGLHAQSGFVAEGGGLVDTYVRLGVPAAIFLFAVYFLLRAGRKAKYSITFPHFAERVPKVIGTDASEIMAAWGRADAKRGGHLLPSYPEEMAGSLAEMKGGKGKTGISEHSMLRVLRELSKEGKFSECSGAFMPASELGGFSPQELSALRLLHDLLLERGIPFRREHEIAARRYELEMVLFSGKKSVLAGIGRLRRAIVFCSRRELEQFEESLNGNEREDVRIKLAIANGKVLLVPALKADIEAMLP